MNIRRLFSPVFALLLAATIAATALAADVAGTWTWTIKTKNDREIENKLTLKADGEKLTGELARGRQQRRRTEISNGTIKGDEIRFEVTAERNGNKFTAKYEGKVEGDTIKGTVTASRPNGGAGRSRPWEAKREK